MRGREGAQPMTITRGQRRTPPCTKQGPALHVTSYRLLRDLPALSAASLPVRMEMGNPEGL